MMSKMKKWIQSTLLVLTLVGVGLACTAQGSAQSKENLSVEEFKEMAAKEKALVIDVRTDGEVTQGGIKDARQIDFYKEGFLDAFKDIPRNRPILLYCHSGNRSGQALEQLKSMGFTRVAHLQSGIVGWSQAKEPVVPMKSKER
jgi:phage shock protein E